MAYPTLNPSRLRSLQEWLRAAQSGQFEEQLELQALRLSEQAGEELVNAVSKSLLTDEAMETAQKARDYTEFLRLFRLMKAHNDGAEPYDFIQAPAIEVR